MLIDKLSGDALVGLFFVAITHAFVVAVMISAAHISGGHLNPAVTLGLLVGGHITIVRSVLYWIDQLIASAAACYLLHYLTGGLVSIRSSHTFFTEPVKNGVSVFLLVSNTDICDYFDSSFV